MEYPHSWGFHLLLRWLRSTQKGTSRLSRLSRPLTTCCHLSWCWVLVDSQKNRSSVYKGNFLTPNPTFSCSSKLENKNVLAQNPKNWREYFLWSWMFHVHTRAKSQLFIKKFSRIWCLKYVNFVKIGLHTYMRILWKMRIWNCEFCEKWDFEVVNFLKNENLKCEFCQKWQLENVNFVKNETLKLWILSKMILWNGEFCVKWDFEMVNFV